MLKKRQFGEFVGDIETRVPKPYIKQVGAIIPGQTAFATAGLLAPGVALNPVVDLNDAGGRALNCPTAGGAGTQGGYAPAAYVVTQSRWNPYLSGKFQIVAPFVTFRFWAGLFSGNPTAVDSPAAAGTDAIAIRCSSSAANTNIVAYTSNGAFGTQNIADFAVPVLFPVAGGLNIHTFSIEVGNAGAGVTITLDTQSVSFLTNLPVIATDLGVYFGITSLGVPVNNFRFYNCYFEADR